MTFSKLGKSIAFRSLGIMLKEQIFTSASGLKFRKPFGFGKLRNKRFCTWETTVGDRIPWESQGNTKKKKRFCKSSEKSVFHHNWGGGGVGCSLSLPLPLPTCNIGSLRTFAPIVSAHPYCARKFTRHVIHERAR